MCVCVVNGYKGGSVLCVNLEGVLRGGCLQVEG
jgi:hypothetical protein